MFSNSCASLRNGNLYLIFHGVADMRQGRGNALAGFYVVFVAFVTGGTACDVSGDNR